MKKHNVENLFLVLGFIVIFITAAGISLAVNIKGGHHSPIVYLRNVSVASYTAVSNVTISLTNGGTFTNGSFTFFYRVNGTNSGGRLPISAVVTQSFTGSTNTNAVVISWENKDGVRRYVVERSEDGINFTNTLTFKASVTQYIDQGTDTFTVGFFTNDVAVIPEPEVPWPEMAGTNDTTRWAENKANTNVNMDNFNLTNANLGRFIVLDIVSGATIGVLVVNGNIDVGDSLTVNTNINVGRDLGGAGFPFSLTNFFNIQGSRIIISGPADDIIYFNSVGTNIASAQFILGRDKDENEFFIEVGSIPSGTPSIGIAQDGNVGINRNNGRVTLDVVGTIWVSNTATSGLEVVNVISYSNLFNTFSVEALSNVTASASPVIGDRLTWDGDNWTNIPAQNTNTETLTWVSIGAVSTGSEIDGFRVMSSSGTIQRVWMTLGNRGNNGSNVVDINIGSLSGSFTTQQNAIVLSTIYTDQADRPTLEGLSGSSSDNAFIEAPLPAITNFDIGDVFSTDVDISTGLDADLIIMMRILLFN